MSSQKSRYTTDPLILRNETGLIISSSDSASKIENLVETPEGTLRSIEGPAPFIPKTSDGDFPVAYSNTGNFYGLYHTTLRNGVVDILLLHSDDSIYRFRGWNTSTPFEKIIGSSGGGGVVKLTLDNTDAPNFPTQFESTSKGVVIVPQNSRAVFFNGEFALPLGYSSTPPAAMGSGPSSSDPGNTSALKINDEGYAISRVSDGLTLDPAFGFGRLGTAFGPVDNTSPGGVLSGDYSCAYQWLDIFGNLSPLSPRSGTAHIDRQQVSNFVLPPELVMKQLLWSNISTGPKGTVGRVLSRTRDARNSGTQKLFIVPGNIGYGTTGAFATMPDNSSTRWPDNVPDAWIVAEPHDVMPVPVFKLCRLAFGRLWVANTTDDPGILLFSMPGRYGTFLNGSEFFPDPNGGEITGLWSTKVGLLVFTATSTFIVTPGDDGKDFRVNTLNATVGCVAPSSIVNMPDGSTIWLGREGFYVFDGQAIVLVSQFVQREVDRINPVRAKQSVAAFDVETKEYRCWTPIDASRRNNYCFVFDGSGWRRRTHETVQAVCTTKDHRNYMLAAGSVSSVVWSSSGTFGTTADRTASVTEEHGIWVLDRSVGNYEVYAPTAKIETAWIEWNRSKDKKTVKSIYLGLRESYKGSATVKVYRDWRISSDPTYTDTTSALLYLEEDAPPFWGETVFGADEWVRRRPYWKRVDVSVPACEVYKIVIESDKPMEFVGIIIDEEPKAGGFGTRLK
jgi:hypothetical protein